MPSKDDTSDQQRSTEGDARRELHLEADRVFNGDVTERLIRVRQSSNGSYYVKGYSPDSERS